MPAVQRRRRPKRGPVLSAERLRAIGDVLDGVVARCDMSARLRADPVEFVHHFDDLEDREITAVIASSFAFGNVKAFRVKIEEALTRLGPHPARAADDAKGLAKKLLGFKHRIYRDGDVVALILGARRVQVAEGGLGRALSRYLALEKGDLRAASGRWVDAIRTAGGLDERENRGASHILARPTAGSAAKRVMLLFRWMVRRADGVDLGAWDVSPSLLMMPVDTHIQKLGKNLGLTREKTANWRAAEEITRALSALDATDPVKYDFALCHMGMLQRCPSRRDQKRCDGCGVQPVCVHWSASDRRRRARDV